MSDLVLTAANVIPSTTATLKPGTFGATVTAGQAVYQDTGDLDAKRQGKWKLADANGASALIQTATGIAANSGSAGQPAIVCTEDSDFTHGLTGVVSGDIIIATATPGGLALAADLASGWMPNVLMVAKSATKAVFKIVSGTAVK